MAQSDLVFVEGSPVNEGAGSNDFVKDEGTDLVDDPDVSNFVYEQNVPWRTLSVLQLEPPIDIAITADNFVWVYANSTSNLVYSESGLDDFDADGSDGELQWQQVAVINDISLPADSESVIGIRWWNGPDAAEIYDPQLGDTSQQGFVMTFRDANGKTVAFQRDTFSLTIDARFDETTDGNPYGEDWVDPNFDDSAWEQVQPSTLNISDSSWSAGFDDTLSTNDFFDTDPQWANQHPESVDSGDIDLQGFAFARVRIKTT